MNDGITKKFESRNDVSIGQVVRMINSDGTVAPFSDALVLSYDEKMDSYHLARPYGFASGTETSGPTPLLGCESYEVPWASLKEHAVSVLTSRGLPYKMTT